MAGEGESLAKRIREFFRDLLGSRITEHLEVELLRLRTDFEQRLQDKDQTIASLREEKSLLMSKITTYEMTIMPYASRAGAEVVAYQKPKKPAFSFVDVPAPKSRWQKVQDDWEEQLSKDAEEEKQKVATAAKE
jgi:hypothetical protein